MPIIELNGGQYGKGHIGISETQHEVDILGKPEALVETPETLQCGSPPEAGPDIHMHQVAGTSIRSRPQTFRIGLIEIPDAARNHYHFKVPIKETALPREFPDRPNIIRVDEPDVRPCGKLQRAIASNGRRNRLTQIDPSNVEAK